MMSLSPVRDVGVVVPVSRRVRLAVDDYRVCDTLEASPASLAGTIAPMSLPMQAARRPGARAK